MTCKERIDLLEQSIRTLEKHLEMLRALPESDSDPGIIAAIAETEAALTAAKIQLANEKASCDDSAEALPAARARGATSADREIAKLSKENRKHLLTATKRLARHSAALNKAIGGNKESKDKRKKPGSDRT